MKQPKTNFAILGLIMVFSDIILWNIALGLNILSSQYYFYFYLVSAGMILIFAGFIIIGISHSWTLAAGAVFLVFGINRIMAGAYYPPFSFDDPSLSQYVSHFMVVGCIFICVGVPLILASLFNRGKK